MAELLVVSDSHGDIGSLSSIFRWARKRNLDSLAFLGDGAADLEVASARTDYWPKAVRRVRGNCDGDPSLGVYGTFDFADRRFFIAHGHTLGVQDSFDALLLQAGMAGAGAALYGHTHVPFWDEVDGLLVLNPGSPSRPRCGAPPTFATIDCPADGSWFLPRHWVVQGNTVRPFEPEE